MLRKVGTTLVVLLLIKFSRANEDALSWVKIEPNSMFANETATANLSWEIGKQHLPGLLLTKVYHHAEDAEDDEDAEEAKVAEEEEIYSWKKGYKYERESDIIEDEGVYENVRWITFKVTSCDVGTYRVSVEAVDGFSEKLVAFSVLDSRPNIFVNDSCLTCNGEGGKVPIEFQDELNEVLRCQYQSTRQGALFWRSSNFQLSQTSQLTNESSDWQSEYDNSTCLYRVCSFVAVRSRSSGKIFCENEEADSAVLKFLKEGFRPHKGAVISLEEMKVLGRDKRKKDPIGKDCLKKQDCYVPAMLIPMACGLALSGFIMVFCMYKSGEGGGDAERQLKEAEEAKGQLDAKELY